jgi:hypothetical protein
VFSDERLSAEAVGRATRVVRRRTAHPKSAELGTPGGASEDAATGYAGYLGVLHGQAGEV